MKLRLTVELDLPDECSEWSDPELRQMVWDSYVHYVTVSHLRDQLTWLVHSQNKPECATTKEIHDIHKNWADIGSKAGNTFTIERL